jgi:hypothetical protein
MTVRFDPYLENPKITRRPLVAGLLGIVNGMVNLYTGISVAALATYLLGTYSDRTPGWLIGLPFFILGIVIVTGSIFGIIRKRWRLVLTGAICGLLFPVAGLVFIIVSLPVSLFALTFDIPMLAISITTLVLIVISKPEFIRK